MSTLKKVTFKPYSQSREKMQLPALQDLVQMQCDDAVQILCTLNCQLCGK